jgi:hypothetical protein
MDGWKLAGCGDEASSIPANFIYFITQPSSGAKLAVKRNMNFKSLLAPALGAAGLAAAVLMPIRSQGEVGPDDPAFANLLKEVSTQQATIADNQAKIDDKLAAIAEDVRLARAFSARGR